MVFYLKFPTYVLIDEFKVDSRNHVLFEEPLTLATVDGGVLLFTDIEGALEFNDRSSYRFEPLRLDDPPELKRLLEFLLSLGYVHVCRDPYLNGQFLKWSRVAIRSIVDALEQ